MAAIVALSFLSGGYIFSLTATVVFVGCAVGGGLGVARATPPDARRPGPRGPRGFRRLHCLGGAVDRLVRRSRPLVAGLRRVSPLPHRSGRRHRHAGRPRAAPPGRLRLRRRDGAGGRLCLPRKSVARRGDARPSLPPSERSAGLLERAGDDDGDGRRAGARGRFAALPAGRRARRLRRRARALCLHLVLLVLARRHAGPGPRPRRLLRPHQRAAAGRPQSGADRRARRRGPLPRPPSGHAFQLHLERRAAYRPGTRLRALGARRDLPGGSAPGGRGARRPMDLARGQGAAGRRCGDAGPRRGGRGDGRPRFRLALRRRGRLGAQGRAPVHVVRRERQSAHERRRPPARARQQRSHPHGPRGAEGLPRTIRWPAAAQARSDSPTTCTGPMPRSS